MTGHQDNPGSGYNLQGEVASAIKIEDVLHAYGYENVIVVDPQDLTAMQKAVDDALASEVPAAIVSRRPCLLIKRIKHDIGQCVVDTDKCIGCKKCLSVGCPAVMIKGKKSCIDPNQCVGCTVCAQVCPVGAISRKEK
jgi:indolepyruvate ferredoxin oxidoreductase alpha subunit